MNQSSIQTYKENSIYKEGIILINGYPNNINIQTCPITFKPKKKTKTIIINFPFKLELMQFQPPSEECYFPELDPPKIKHFR